MYKENPILVKKLPCFFLIMSLNCHGAYHLYGYVHAQHKRQKKMFCFVFRICNLFFFRLFTFVCFSLSSELVYPFIVQCIFCGWYIQIQYFVQAVWTYNSWCCGKWQFYWENKMLWNLIGRASKRLYMVLVKEKEKNVVKLPSLSSCPSCFCFNNYWDAQARARVANAGLN